LKVCGLFGQLLADESTAGKESVKIDREGEIMGFKEKKVVPVAPPLLLGAPEPEAAVASDKEKDSQGGGGGAPVDAQLAALLATNLWIDCKEANELFTEPDAYEVKAPTEQRQHKAPGYGGKAPASSRSDDSSRSSPRALFVAGGGDEEEDSDASFGGASSGRGKEEDSPQRLVRKARVDPCLRDSWSAAKTPENARGGIAANVSKVPRQRARGKPTP
ncbi:hypothetical protein T484DRAFT_1840948, partial [Baffinella frigidus]